jgi:lysyl-tRNA synthetase class 2
VPAADPSREPEDAPVAPPSDRAERTELFEQMRVRADKRDRLLASGVAPYPVAVPRTLTLADVRERWPDLAAGTETDEVVSVAGRVVFLREAGRLVFATLQEGDGTRLQVMLSEAAVGPDALAAWKSDVDLGDHVSVTGAVGTSRRGELSVFAREWALAAKALRPLPTLHKDLSEEARVRTRYVDLMVRDEARGMVRAKAAVLRALRETFHERGFVEVETPVLQAVHGGATARPFRTRVNALGVEMSLRIATELYLKRCIVGGVDKVYEIGRNFRNEGIDSSHSPEFTMLETYEAYGSGATMQALTRDLVTAAARAVGRESFAGTTGEPVDLVGEWPVLTVHGTVSDALGEEVTPDTDAAQLRRLAEAAGVAVKPEWSAGEVVLELYEKLVEPTIREPAFVGGYPVDVRPLARQDPDDPRLAAAWDLVVDGTELAALYTELTDPVVQRERLVAQSLRAAQGDPEAMSLDEDFLRALEYGMPPTGGMGMGVDRLVMLLMGVGIRETILFPLLRPEV